MFSVTIFFVKTDWILYLKGNDRNKLEVFYKLYWFKKYQILFAYYKITVCITYFIDDENNVINH